MAIFVLRKHHGYQGKGGLTSPIDPKHFFCRYTCQPRLIEVVAFGDRNSLIENDQPPLVSA
jgi:hypothetical protein